MERNPYGSMPAMGAVVALLLAGCGGSDGEPRTASECEDRARTADQLVADLPAGWRAGPADKELVDTVTAALPREGRRRTTSRTVAKGREAGAVLLVVEVRRPHYADQFLKGASQSVGDMVQDVQFGDTRATLYRAGNGTATLLGKSARCAAALLSGKPAGALKVLARDLPAEAEPTDG